MLCSRYTTAKLLLSTAILLLVFTWCLLRGITLESSQPGYKFHRDNTKIDVHSANGPPRGTKSKIIVRSQGRSVVLGRPMEEPIDVNYIDNMYITVRTTAKYYKERLLLQMMTWLQIVKHKVIQCYL